MAGSDRGFASMDEAKQKEIASKGGKASRASRSNSGNSGSSSNASGAAGSTEAAKRGGQHSRRQ